jgi:hypothetical protein
MEFTGSYYKCFDCYHIYDFDDCCPECGSGNVEDINANEVKEIAKTRHSSDRLKLLIMLGSHDD